MKIKLTLTLMCRAVKQIAIVFFLLIGLRVYAQDSNAVERQEAALETNQQQSELLRAMADSARMADSIEQLKLLEQLEELRSSDIAQKQRLQFRIDSISEVKRLRAERNKQRIDSLRSFTKGMPVVFNRDTLFLIYSKLGPFSPAERATRIAEKLESLGDAVQFDEAQLVVFQSEDGYDLMYADQIILTVNDQDEFWANASKQSLVETRRELVLASIQAYRDDNSLLKILLRGGLILLVAGLLVLMIWLMNLGFNKLVVRIRNSSDNYIKGIKLKEYEFLSPERELQLVFWVLNAFKWLLIALIVYISLPVVFSIFPTTEGFAKMMFGYVMNPLASMLKGIIGFIPSFITILIIIALTRYFVRFIRFLSTEVETGKLVLPGFYADWAKPTYNLLRVLIYAFSFVVIFPYLPGSNSPAFQGVSVFLGLLISLGSSSTIGNIIAGLVITYMRPFKIGDRVKIGDTVGDVTGKTMLATRVRTIKNEDVSIPNSAILSGSTVNYSSSAQNLGLILHTSVTIGYDVPWKKVHELLISAALKSDLVDQDPKPFVLQTSLDDFYVSYQLNAYTKRPELSAKIYSEIHANIQDAFNEAQVEILSPHYRAARDGNMVTIPESYLPPEYKAPTFNVNLKKDE